jgi:transposase
MKRPPILFHRGFTCKIVIEKRLQTGITANKKEVAMNSIVYVGMDVHKDSFTVCSYTLEEDVIKYRQKLSPDYKMILKYINGLRKSYSEDVEVVCGYEAGCLGYTLYHELSSHGINCVILAPTTMAVTNKRHVKTDKRDASNIARCLAFKTYSAVYIPTDEDNSIKEFIRMRDDQKKMLKMTKQQILALLLRHGKRYEGGKTNWTVAHMSWLRSLDLGGVLQESLDEYLITLNHLVTKVERLDRKIEELANGEAYKEKVSKLSCFMGIKTHTALSLIVEVGDYDRFSKAKHFSSYLGLVPSEDSSGSSQKKSGITKAGNGHLRRLLVEAAQSYTRGTVGYKSKTIKKRQEGNSPQVIAYADKASERLRRKFYKMTLQNGTKHNVAVTAIARELSCFVWGMLTDNIA